MNPASAILVAALSGSAPAEVPDNNVASPLNSEVSSALVSADVNNAVDAFSSATILACQNQNTSESSTKESNNILYSRLLLRVQNSLVSNSFTLEDKIIHNISNMLRLSVYNESNNYKNFPISSRWVNLEKKWDILIISYEGRQYEINIEFSSLKKDSFYLGKYSKEQLLHIEKALRIFLWLRTSNESVVLK